MKFGIGQSVLRVEDKRLLRGKGRFTGDINLPEQIWVGLKLASRRRLRKPFRFLPSGSGQRCRCP